MARPRLTYFSQRAFRQRKEGHIKALETQVREFNQLNDAYKAVQAENNALREYIVALQGDMLQRLGNYPQPPAHIDLRSHRDSIPEASSARQDENRSEDPQHPANRTAPTAPMRSFEDDLQVSAAQAVAEHKQRGEDVVRVNAGPPKRPRTAETSPPHGLPTSSAP